MANYLVDQGIPRAAIFEDNEGNNTFASAKKTAALCAERKIRRVMVISQYFHIPRAELALKKFGVPHVLHAHANYVEWARDLYSLSRELAGFITYYFKSYPPIVLGAAFTWGGPRS